MTSEEMDMSDEFFAHAGPGMSQALHQAFLACLREDSMAHVRNDLSRIILTCTARRNLNV